MKAPSRLVLTRATLVSIPLVLVVMVLPMTVVAADRDAGIQFEAASDPMYGLQSRFVGSAVVGSNSIEVRIESGVLSLSPKRKPGERRFIHGYNVGLLQPEGRRSRMISYSPMIEVGTNVSFGEKLMLGPANLSIPLANITARTNHWLLFSMKEGAEMNGRFVGSGTSHSETATNLFTNLVVTGLTKPSLLPNPSAEFPGFIMRIQKRFQTIEFVPPEEGGKTAFQRLNVPQNIVGTFGPRQFTGIQFTIPDWADGDFEYAFVYLYRNQDELLRRPRYSWDVASAPGRKRPRMNNVERVPFDGLPVMQARFPITEDGYQGSINQEQLIPGETYFLWWGYDLAKDGAANVPPDLAVALTIRSERGTREFGDIVWR